MSRDGDGIISLDEILIESRFSADLMNVDSFRFGFMNEMDFSNKKITISQDNAGF